MIAFAMIERRPDGRPPEVPATASTPDTERRRGPRRAEDRLAHQERVLLARTLDVLAGDGSAEERLAGLLRVLARTVGARRAAVVADGAERRAVVALDDAEDAADAEALAAWLDANAPRSRARRAAAGRAPISFLVGGRGDGRGDVDRSAGFRTGAIPPLRADGRARHFAILAVPASGDVALGFEFVRSTDAARVADRLPPAMARHAGVALALVTSQVADERELAELRARDAERTTFVSTVAHELRTPLTGLGGYLGLILDGKVSDAAVERDFLERSRSIVGSMTELVGDLLEIARIESGTID